MTIEDIERAAMQGIKPHYLTVLQKYLYRELKCLHILYRMGRLTRDEASAEKKDILADFYAMEERWSVLSEYQENIRMAETLRSEIDKSDNAADKLRLALECIECMTGEVGFAKRNLKGVEDDV